MFHCEQALLLYLRNKLWLWFCLKTHADHMIQDATGHKPCDLSPNEIQPSGIGCLYQNWRENNQPLIEGRFMSYALKQLCVISSHVWWINSIKILSMSFTLMHVITVCNCISVSVSVYLLSMIISVFVSRMLTLYKFAALWLFLFVFQPFHPH